MSQTVAKLRWDTSQSGVMTEEVIRARHLGGQTRISRYRYEAGDEIEGVTKRCTGYVLSGRFVFLAGGSRIAIDAGEMFTFSGGDYILKVESNEPAIVLWVWTLANFLQ